MPRFAGGPLLALTDGMERQMRAARASEREDAVAEEVEVVAEEVEVDADVGVEHNDDVEVDHDVEGDAYDAAIEEAPTEPVSEAEELRRPESGVGRGALGSTSAQRSAADRNRDPSPFAQDPPLRHASGGCPSTPRLAVSRHDPSSARW